jgi:hypothetical protein
LLKPNLDPCLVGVDFSGDEADRSSLLADRFMTDPTRLNPLPNSANNCPVDRFLPIPGLAGSPSRCAEAFPSLYGVGVPGAELIDLLGADLASGEGELVAEGGVESFRQNPFLPLVPNGSRDSAGVVGAGRDMLTRCGVDIGSGSG